MFDYICNYCIKVITYYIVKYLLRPISNTSVGIACNNERIKTGATTIKIINYAKAV